MKFIDLGAVTVCVNHITSVQQERSSRTHDLVIYYTDGRHDRYNFNSRDERDIFYNRIVKKLEAE